MCADVVYIADCNSFHLSIRVCMHSFIEHMHPPGFGATPEHLSLAISIPFADVSNGQSVTC